MDSLKKFNLVEISPQDEVVSKYIEKYQYFHIEKETWIKSLPNARLDCWFIFDGELNIWNEVKKEFSPAPAIGGYPATNTSLLFHIPGNLSCLNLKLHLRSLTIPFFRNLYPANPYTDLTQHNIPATPINEKSIHIQGQVNIEYLDHWALNLIATSQSDLTIQSLLDVIQNKKVTTVKGLAEHSELSARNLQRVTQKAFNLSPKELLRVFRFSQTTSYFKANPQKAFIDALSFGYYDQSHFIRECKRISGVPPKELFANMTLSVPDLMVFD